jgi:hypothetical protein
MNDIKKIQELFSKSLKEYRQSSQATRDSHLKTEKPERFLILDPEGNTLSTPLGKLKTDASIRALHTRLRRYTDGQFINNYKNTPLAIYDTKNKEVIEVLYLDSNMYWQFAFNIASLGDNKQFTYMFSIKPKNSEITEKSNNQNEIMNDIKKIQEFFSKPLEEAELKLGVKYELPNGDTGYIMTGGSNDSKDWIFSGGSKKVPYLSVKSKLKPLATQPRKYDGAFDLGLGKGHHIDESVNEGPIEDIQKQLDDLGVKYEMSKTDKVRPFKAIYKPINKSDEFYDKFEDIVDLFNLKGVVKSSMNEANGFKSGKEFINIKLQKYPKAVAKINQLISMVGESNFTMEMAEWIFNFFNNASYESPVNESKISHFKIGDVVELKSIPGNLPSEIRKGIIDNKWEITRVSKFVGDNNRREDVFGYDIELLDKKVKYKMFVYPEDVKQPMNEAKSEDKVDTITMDVPLFLRMLEYSREDAEQDLDLHDITEKAILLGKERGILQMDDYEEIVDAIKKTEENVAPNHDGKAAPFGSGYKPLEERISEAFEKINEELCPAGKAYRKRRMAAGEKSSAYLSGRAVKVCKGQMSGKKKKK